MESHGPNRARTRGARVGDLRPRGRAGGDVASRAAGRPLACVLGNTDLIRPLGRAGIRCAVLSRPDSPKALSRFVDVRIDWADNWGDPDRMLRNLVEFADGQPTRPVLFFQFDGDLVFVSRNREALSPLFRFAIAESDLVERLVDKRRFHELALERGLPIPTTAVVSPSTQPEPPDLALRFPLVLKPMTRRDVVWRPLAGHAKALLMRSPAALEELWPRLAAARVDLLAQELVEGDERRIESYHAYVDERGDVAGEFTGQKIRTEPPSFGETTALELTDAADVRELGRRCMAELGLRGVAKLDFKRAPSGRLFLLEVNARFNLWHHAGAVAGVNLPALYYADLAGVPRPAVRKVRPGVRWTLPWHDLSAARREGVPFGKWLAWQARCETRHMVALDDPIPFLRGFVWRHAKRRLGRGPR